MRRKMDTSLRETSFFCGDFIQNLSAVVLLIALLDEAIGHSAYVNLVF